MNDFFKIPAYLVGISCLSAQAADYYVSTTNDASDNNPGTQNSPWASPQEATRTAIAGDTVNFEDGTWDLADIVRFKNKGTATNPIVFRSVNLHGAKLKLPNTVVGVGDALFSIGIFQSGKWQEEQEMYIVIDGLDLEGGRRHTIQATGGGQLTIKNCKIHHSGNDPIKINSAADYVLIENNEIYESGVGEEQICSETHACNSDGIDITSSDFVTVRGNHIHDIASWGIYTKKGSENTIIENNIIHDTYVGGIGLGESTVTYNAIARNNILYNIDHSCLQFSGGKESKFYNNTCYNVSRVFGSNWAGMRVAPAEHTAGAKEGDDKYSRNIEFYNNVIVLNNSDGYCFKASDPSFAGTGKAAHIAQMKMDNNLCYNLSGSSNYFWKFEGKVQSGIDAWRSYTNELGTAQSTNDIVDLAPEFVQVSNENSDDLFLPEAFSPLIDSGIDLSEDVAKDYYGFDREANAFDIGAVENTRNVMPTPINVRSRKN